VKDLVNMLTYSFFKLQNRITTYAFQQDIGLMFFFSFVLVHWFNFYFATCILICNVPYLNKMIGSSGRLIRQM